MSDWILPNVIAAGALLGCLYIGYVAGKTDFFEEFAALLKDWWLYK